MVLLRGRVGRWAVFGVDGSRVECPRTKANEAAFGSAGRRKTGPQQFLTTLFMLYDPIRKLNKVNLILQEATAASQRVSRLIAVRSPLSSAESASGSARSTPLNELATSLRTDAASSSDRAKVDLLAKAVSDLAGM